MAYILFFVYLIIIVAALFICNHFRPVKLQHAVIGITTAACSVAVEMILGSWAGFYHYLDSKNSILYMTFAGIFIYPALNMIYVLFLPERLKGILIYTVVWIAAMMGFEYLSVIQHIVVFTGWKAVPFSFIMYFSTYLWINLFYRFLKRAIKPAPIIK